MRYLIRRLGFFVLTLWAALTINFLIPRLMPGSPATAILARFHGRLTPTALHAIEASLGINTNQGIASQYVQYIGNTATLNFGDSVQSFQPVAKIVAQAIPWTLALVGITTTIAKRTLPCPTLTCLTVLFPPIPSVLMRRTSRTCTTRDTTLPATSMPLATSRQAGDPDAPKENRG